MANFFDQFDAAAPAAAASSRTDGGNFFDQFDAPASGVTQGVTAPLRIQMGNPEPTAAPEQVSAPVDFARSIPGGMLSGLSNMLSAGGQAAQIEMGQPVDVPDAQAVKGNIEQNVTGPLPTPQGAAGQFGASVGEVLGNPATYVAPGGIAAKVGMGVLGGLGSEAGGQLAQGTPYEAPARFVGGMLGAGVAAKAAQPAQVASAIGARPSGAAPTFSALKASAKAGYESPEVAAVTLNSNAVAQKVDGLIASLGQDIHPVLAPKTFAILESASKAPAGSVSTFENLRNLRRMLGKAAGSVDATEREAAQTAIKGVDEIMTSMPKDAVLSGNPEAAFSRIKTANADYSAAKTSEKFDKKVQKAELSAEASNSGMNVGNRIKQHAVQILTNDKLRRGFKPDEIAKLEELAKGSTNNKTVRWFANLFGGGGGIGALLTAEIGKHAFGKFGLALAPVGMVLKHIENAMTVRQAQELSEMIRSRSPLGQAVTNAARDWDKAREALVSGPSSAKFAAFSLASRNLSNNLASVGVRVHPLQLIKAAGDNPMDSSADDKKK